MKIAKLISAALIIVLLASLPAAFFGSPTAGASSQELPDLVVLRVWRTSNQIWYSIKNVGQGSVGGAVAPASFYNVLLIDGQQVAEDKITTSLATGQQLDRAFSYQWQPTSGQHSIRVCADWRQDIQESNEGNNCWEGMWTVGEEKLPDLIVEKIECRADNKLWVTIKNIGSGAIPTGWKALGEAYFDGIKKGNFDLTYPTSTLNGGIENPGGSSTYFTNWDVTTEVRVRVVVDFTNEIKESNEQNNSREEKVKPAVTKLPDLLIEEIKCDRDNNRIGYVIRNNGEAVASSGHATALYVDGKEVAHDLVGVDLQPGATHESWFKEYKWLECKTLKVRVCADSHNQVKESDEQNNCLEKTCECVVDVTPPNITSGPTVFQVTQTSAVICWTTDEASDSLIEYDSRAGKYKMVAKDANLVKKHCLTLTKLEPATTYHFIVESKDSSGNKVTSRDLSFETLSPPDKAKPSVSLRLPDKLSGRVPITADAQDNISVDRVVFFLDGKPMYTDYAPPFEWDLDTRGLDDGSHSITTQAFDAAGNAVKATQDVTVQNRFPAELSPVHVRIINPESGAEVAGVVGILAEVDHDHGLRIQEIQFKVDGEVVKSVGGGDFTPLRESYSWDVSGLKIGSTHVIEVSARDEAGNWGHAGVRVRIASIEFRPPPLEMIPVPSIQVTRWVERNSNYFIVRLQVRNDGPSPVKNLRITEIGHERFLFAGGETTDYRRYAGKYNSGAHTTSLIIRKGDPLNPKREFILRAGESWEFRYYLIPLVTVLPVTAPRELASGGVRLEFEFEHEGSWRSSEYTLPPEATGEHMVSASTIRDALTSADYLIITYPSRLFSSYGAGSANNLLKKIGELARLRGAVFAPIGGDWSAPTLKRVIREDWGPQLSSSFLSNGYLLLVGETEIVPSFNIPCHLHFTGEGTCPICGAENVDALTRIRITDYPYADISGDAQPELKVGRIIGGDADTLYRSIQASIEKGGFGDFAVTTSGGEGGWETFVPTTNELARILQDKGLRTTTLHWTEMFVQEAFHVDFRHNDGFALGDVDDDDDDEIIIASERNDRIYLYEPDGSPIRDFPVETFTPYDGLTAGDVDDDGEDEIIIASDDNHTLYVYDPDGTPLAPEESEHYINKWNAYAAGEVGWRFVHTYEVDPKDRILILDKDHDQLSVWEYEEPNEFYWHTYYVRFTRYDGFAVRKRPHYSSSRGHEVSDEIVVAVDEDDKVYRYETRWDDSLRLIGSFDCKFTRYDGFATGDHPGLAGVGGEGGDEVFILNHEDKKIHIYGYGKDPRTGESTGEWQDPWIYSRFLKFNGIRYTGSPTKYDGFAVGNVLPAPGDEIVIAYNRDGPNSSIYYIITDYDARGEGFRNLLSRLAPNIDILAHFAHGNPGGSTPLLASQVENMNFSSHPLVIASSCLTGNYDEGGFAEAFFKAGAAAYIGSTEPAPAGEDEEFAKGLFRDYFRLDRTIGEALTDLKRAKVRRSTGSTVGDWWSLVVYEYNLYGDPKLGAR